MRRVCVLGAVSVSLALSAPARAELPEWSITDLGEAGRLAKLVRGPDDRLHLLYVSQDGFRWRIWDGSGWNAPSTVPDTQGQGSGKFNNPAIAALGDGSFHVVWGPPASWGVSHDVYLQSHDGSGWGARQTISGDYTEYLALAPLPGSQLMVVGGIVCPGACSAAVPLATMTGASGGAFTGWTELPIAQPEAKTPVIFVQPNSDVFHLVSRWSRASHLRWDGTSFGQETLLFPKSSYSIGLPAVSASPAGDAVVFGVEWLKLDAGVYAIDHARLASQAGGSWLPGVDGEQIAPVVAAESGVSADAQGGVHAFFFEKDGELGYRYAKDGVVSGPAVIATGVDFTGPETDTLATSYTDHHVHVIVPVAGTLRHVLIQTDPPASDASADAAGGAGEASLGGGGGSGGADASSAGTGAVPGGSTSGEPDSCGCRTPGRSGVGGWWLVVAMVGAAGRGAGRARRPPARSLDPPRSAKPLGSLQRCLLALERQRDGAATAVAHVDETVDQPGARPLLQREQRLRRVRLDDP